MKYILLYFFAAFTLLSCKNSKPESIGTGNSQDHPDLVAINDVVHNFYKWYDANLTTTLDMNFLKAGKSTTLEPAKLDAYFAALLKSGYISQAYVDAERAYLKNLEATAWKNENVAEQPLTGLDYNRFFCGQDWDINFWTTAPVAAEGLGTDRLTATITGTEGGSPRQQNLELVKENGKWLIAKVDCETGVDEAAAGAEQLSVEQLAAFYSGTLPCEDCDGIATLLTLNADEKRTFSLEEEYKGKNGKTVESSGTWTVDGDVVTLTGKSGSNKYQVTGEGLISLNADASKRNAKSAEKYLLKKTQGE